MPPFEPRRPRPVEGGIKARNQRGSIGERWWSRRFIDVMESFADKGRLGRGRTYARKGQVLELVVKPHEVTALVQGSEADPYEIAIGIEAIGEDTWQRIETELAGRAVFRAQLLAGEMPRDIDQVFDGLGASLFPETADDLHLMCSCLDWGDPCKHVAAALYVLAEAFDDDPFLILAWNGRTRDELLTTLRRGGPATSAPDPLLIEDTPLTADGFWTPVAGLARLREHAAAPLAPAGLLLRLLEPPKIKVRRRNLTDILEPAYAGLASTGEVPPRRSGES